MMIEPQIELTDEGLIRWACNNGAIDENKLHKRYMDIVVYCAGHTISIGRFLQTVVLCVNNGVGLGRAIDLVKSDNPN